MMLAVVFWSGSWWISLFEPNHLGRELASNPLMGLESVKHLICTSQTGRTFWFARGPGLEGLGMVGLGSQGVMSQIKFWQETVDTVFIFTCRVRVLQVELIDRRCRLILQNESNIKLALSFPCRAGQLDFESFWVMDVPVLRERLRRRRLLLPS